MLVGSIPVAATISTWLKPDGLEDHELAWRQILRAEMVHEDAIRALPRSVQQMQEREQRWRLPPALRHGGNRPICRD